MCPNCGTLVRKKRGNVKIASTAGVGPSWLINFVDNINRISPKILLAAVACILLVVILIMSFSCGSCAGCGSCDACSSCGSCAGCGSCAACNDSASGSAKPEPTQTKANQLNTGGMICVDENYLYYVSGSAVMRSGNGGDTVLLRLESGEISAINTDGVNLYYIQDGSLWRLPFDATMAQDSAPVPRCIVRKIDETDQISQYISISGYNIVDKEKLCCWGVSTSGSVRISTVDSYGAQLTTIAEGNFSNPKYYNGAVYFYDNSTGKLNRVSLGDKKRTALDINYESSGYALGGGYIYFCEARQDGSKVLCRMSVSGGKKTEWYVGDPYIVGIMANDKAVCFWTSRPEGSDLFRYGHDGNGARFDSKAHAVSMSCMAGDYMLLLDDGKLRLYDGAGNYIQSFA